MREGGRVRREAGEREGGGEGRVEGGTGSNTCILLSSCSNRLLSDYEYIHQCRKFAVPVKLVIVEKKKPSPVRGRRSPLPNLSIPSAFPPNLSRCVSLKEANALLDSYHAKEEKFRGFLKSKQNPVSCTL